MRSFIVALVALIALTACTRAAAEGAFDLTEFSISGPNRLDSGPNSLTVSNSGEFSHTLVVTDSTGQVLAATPLVGPGESVELAVDLAPDRYSFTCRIVAEDGDGNLIDHFESGMAASVEVSG